MNRFPIDQADRKGRFGGVLENPFIALAVRDLLDFGRWQGLVRTMGPLDIKSVLDIGCGWGENSRVCPAGYVGIDNSLSRIKFASHWYPQSRFIHADALEFPIQEKSFDLVMLIDTSHHMTESQLLEVLGKMKASSRQWILVSDPVLYDGQSAVSRFFYGLDRGAMFRTSVEMQNIFCEKAGLRLEKMDFFTTFPGLYRHGTFLLREK
jgi:SAM-dependent methyltransferase